MLALVNRLKTMQSLLCMSLLVSSCSSATAAYHFACPDAGTSVTIPGSDIVQAASSSAGGITVDKTLASGNLCTLTLQDTNDDDPSTVVPIPVARSFDGGNWEITAGPLSRTLPSMTCSPSDCTFVGLPLLASDTDDELNKIYVLTSYSHASPGPEADAARFLEQATFGPTRETIDSLVAEDLIVRHFTYYNCVSFTNRSASNILFMLAPLVLALHVIILASGGCSH